MQENSYIFNFKKFFVFLTKIFIFIVFLIIAIIFFGKKYAKTTTENIINSYNQKRFEEFYNLKKDTLDLVFVGSSHSYCTFDPEIFDNYLNINSYQMGMPLQNPMSTYYTILEILNYQKPKAIVMEIYWGLLNSDFDLNQTKTLFQVLKNKKLKEQYISEAFSLEEKLKYKINILKYQADFFAFKGNEYKQKIKNKFNLKDIQTEKQVGTEYYKDKGFIFSDYKMLPNEFNKTNQFRFFDGKDWTFSKVQKEYLNKIIKLCKDNNINLMFVTAPIANVSMEYIKNYKLVYNEILNFSNKNNIYYIDYNLINENTKLLTNDNFRDDAHLNYSGAKIVSSHFANVLKTFNYF